MTGSSDRARAAWADRPAELGALRVIDGEVAMELRLGGTIEEWNAIGACWATLPPHPHLLAPIDRMAGSIWLRYAALAWARPTEAWTSEELATAGVLLTRVYQHVDAFTPPDLRGWLMVPRLYFDLRGEPRLAFAPPLSQRDALPPERAWPRYSEPGWEFAIGRALAALPGEPDARLARVLERCVEPDPGDRFPRLRDLRVALVLAGGADRDAPPATAWAELEAGLGWHALGNAKAAQARLALAARDPACAALAHRELGEPIAAAPPDREAQARDAAEDARAEARQRGWLGEARRLEAERVFDRAAAAYGAMTMRDPVARLAGLARCELGRGDAPLALGYARAALEAVPGSPEALRVAIDAALVVGQPHAAFAWADALVAACPDDGVAHYKRGRCQLALGQPADARASFERACAAAPTLLEAMYLRREATRAQLGVRATVGEPVALTSALPPRLAPVRDALLAGRPTDALAILARPAYDTDPDAQLLRATILTDHARPGEALVIYERPGPLFDDHREALLLGKARALVALDDLEAALRTLDHAIAEHPASRAALEARAAVLLALGRPAEAERDLGRALEPA